MDEEELRKWHEEFDRRERPGRVERNAAIIRWLEPYEGGMVPGGQEAVLPLAEARDAYIYGLPLASLFASHVACERIIAGFFALLPDNAVPKGWERWGLGRLIREAHIRRWLSEELTNELMVLCERRKVVGHFRRPLDPETETLGRRMGEMFLSGEDFVDTLLSDAAQALRTAFHLAYSPNEGLWRLELFNTPTGDRDLAGQGRLGDGLSRPADEGGHR
jgi:hypothetical protein